MGTKPKEKFISSHKKSSAIMVSLAVHAILLMVAVFFVAVSVIVKEDSQFEVQPVARPKMPPRKLRVSVSADKKKPKPKRLKQITVKSRVNPKFPEFKIPEIAGVKGGLGVAGTGGDLGLGGDGLGISMSTFKVFGVKSKGGRVFIILDSSAEMMYDQMGGIPAYTIIKKELIHLLEELSPETVFNIAVYDDAHTYMLFPSLTAAHPDKVAEAVQWLTPLNAVHSGMGGREYGTRTLGPGGRRYTDKLLVDKFEREELWYRSAMLAMKQQADSVFLLASWWGHHRIAQEARDEDWYATSAGRRWNECYEKGLKMLDEENKQRAANGRPPRVILRGNPWHINQAYFPDIERPPEPDYYYHTPGEFADAFLDFRKQHEQRGVPTALTSRNKKIDFAFNIIHFRKRDPADEDEWRDARSEKNFRKLASLCKSTYRTLAGMKAIQSSRSGRESK